MLDERAQGKPQPPCCLLHYFAVCLDIHKAKKFTMSLINNTEQSLFAIGASLHGFFAVDHTLQKLYRVLLGTKSFEITFVLVVWYPQ